MKIEEIRSKTDSELEFDMGELQKQLFDLRFRSATETAANPSQIPHLRRSIARIHTVLNERSKGIRGQEPR